MSKLQKAISREIRSSDKWRTGKSISRPQMTEVDDAGNYSYTHSIDFGGNRYMKDVIVRPINGSIRYADVGMSVIARKISSGKWETVGPGDAVSDTMVIDYYDLDGTEGSPENLGFDFEQLGFDFYEGPTPGTPGTSLWGSASYHFGYVRIVDGDGNPVA